MVRRGAARPASRSSSIRPAPCCTTRRRSSRGSRPIACSDGGVALFRPEQNARRFQASAERLAMPALPEAAFLRAIEELVKADVEWVPGGDGSLYLRPFMFASEAFLGVRPAAEYWFVVIASPVGAYFKGGKKAVSVWLSADYTRAAPGGTGAAKCGGNYAASLVAQAEAIRHGCDQVVFLDAAERRWIEELGGMNVFFVFDDGSMLTPAARRHDTARRHPRFDHHARPARGRRVREERYGYEYGGRMRRAAGSREAFACGTAAVVTPIGEIKSADGGFVIGNGGGGEVAEAPAGEARRHPARRNRRRIRLGPQGRVGPPSPAAAALRGCAHHASRRAHPFPSSLLGKVAARSRPAQGVARCCEVGRLARPRERTFDDAFLLSTPHPSGFARDPRVSPGRKLFPASRRRGAR